MSPLRAVARFVASVLIVSGTLMITDAAITFAWQEPITALLAKFQQSALKDDLAHAPRRVLQRKPLRGDAIGRIVLPAIHRSYYVVEGTDLGNLAKGPGHYHDTPLPGERGTVGIAGHRTTHGAPFRHIDRLKRGQRITVEMPYGSYVYRVEKKRVVNPDDLSVKRRVRYDRLMLSSCHPPYSAAKRYIVFARFVRRGPAVVGPRRG